MPLHAATLLKVSTGTCRAVEEAEAALEVAKKRYNNFHSNFQRFRCGPYACPEHALALPSAMVFFAARTGNIVCDILRKCCWCLNNIRAGLECSLVHILALLRMCQHWGMLHFGRALVLLCALAFRTEFETTVKRRDELHEHSVSTKKYLEEVRCAAYGGVWAPYGQDYSMQSKYAPLVLWN